MNKSVKKIIAREVLIYLFCVFLMILFVIYNKIPFSLKFVLLFPLAFLIFYIPITIVLWGVRRFMKKRKSDNYGELFNWWFYWGLKMCFGTLICLLMYSAFMGRLLASSPEPISNLEAIRKLSVMYGLLVGFGIMCGLIAVGLKKIKDDELFKLWR